MREDREHREPELRLEPAGSAWAGLVRRPPADDVAGRTRVQLGLPLGRPIIMGGHQPGLWHPGIVAKWWAVQELAQVCGGSAAWVVVDQSPGAGAEVAYPAREGGRLARRALRLGRQDAPPAAQPPATIELPGDAAEEAVAGLRLAAGAMAAGAGAATLARQLHDGFVATLAELDDRGHAPPQSFYASRLHDTDAFGEMLDAMSADPEACARLYNEAAAGHPEADVRALALEPGRVELPLWEMTATPERPGPWRPVMSDRLPDVARDRLAPRGLPMTGLLRRRACDLFVHGTGGGGAAGYDQITEAWLRSWLGAADLAPAVVATATLSPGWGGGPTPSAEDVARAREHAHRAAHDPAALGDEDLGRRKRALAQRIAALPRGSDERARLFEEMRSLRSEARPEHAARVAELRERADALAARATDTEVAGDRTWSLVFQDAGAMRRLRDMVRRELRSER